MRLLVIVAFLFAGGVSWSHDIKNQGEGDLRPSDVGYEHSKNHGTYKRLAAEVNGTELQPSDENYKSGEFGPTYKKLYAGGKCACKSGYCRPTHWRFSELGAASGFDIEVNRRWLPVPKGALHNEKTLSPELWKELMNGASAHVCAYPDSSELGQRIECAIVPDSLG